MNYYVGSYTFTDSLAHHGIKGQRWGIQNGPPYPLSPEDYSRAEKLNKSISKKTASGLRPEELRKAHTIPKGTTIYRTTPSASEGLDGPKYISYLESDRIHYKGGWIRQMGKTGEAYEHTYTLTKDIKVPGREELKEVINGVVGKNPRFKKEVVDAWLETAMPKGSLSRYYATIDSNTGKEDPTKWKKFVDDAMESYGKMTPEQAYFYAAQSFGLAKETRSKVIEELKKRGYNGMTDEASVGGRNGWAREGSDPILLFDGGDSLVERDSKKISESQERRARTDFERWKQKAKRSGGDW